MNRILVHCLLGLRASKWPCPWPVTAETPDPTRVMVDEVAVGQAFCPGICFSPIPVVAWSKLCVCDRSLILMGLWVRIPPRARMFVSCECCASVKEVHGPTANRSATGGKKKKVSSFGVIPQHPTSSSWSYEKQTRMKPSKRRFSGTGFTSILIFRFQLVCLLLSKLRRQKSHVCSGFEPCRSRRIFRVSE